MFPSVTSIQSTNAAAFGTTTYRPTALFVGGTSGIGEGTASALARATKGNVHIIICGRNKASADRIIATFPQTSTSRYDFVKCDATLMNNVVKAAEDIKSLIGESGTINYIFASQGVLNLNGFDPTSEGMDRKIALQFYSRWKFVVELMPCLERATAAGQEARVVSVLNPTLAGVLDVDDIGLKKNYSLLRSGQVSTYNNIMVDEYSRRYPAISFMHVYPGWVATPGGKGFPLLIRALLALPEKLLATSIEDSGEQMLSILVNPVFTNGGFCLNHHGEKFPASKLHSDEAARKALMAHWAQEMAPF